MHFLDANGCGDNSVGGGYRPLDGDYSGPYGPCLRQFCLAFPPPPFSLVEFHSTRLTLVIPYLQIYYFLAMSLYSKRRCLKIMPITSAYYEYES